jgi:hypothetical protein
MLISYYHGLNKDYIHVYLYMYPDWCKPCAGSGKRTWQDACNLGGSLCCLSMFQLEGKKKLVPVVWQD